MSMPSSSESVQLLVVGAGPVGLCAALSAARRGLNVVVLDHVWRGFDSGHASLVHASVLELLDDGSRHRLVSEGRRLERVTLHVDGKLVSQRELPAPALVVPQRQLEEVLLGTLRKRGVEVRTPLRAATITQHEAHVEVRVLRRELSNSSSPALQGEWEPVESSSIFANFVVGADGYESRVRAALGVDVAEVGGMESFAIFEGRFHGDDEPPLQLHFHEGLSGVVVPLGGGRTRFTFQLNEGLDERPDADCLRRLLAERGVAFRGQVEEVEWGSVMHFERRLARRFGKGRVWLAGDSAHVTSPLGCQSMNVGMLEAHELVNAMADCLEGKANLSTLDRQATLHEREWHKLFGVNVRFDVLAHAAPWVSTHARRIVPALPASGADLTFMLERLGLRLS
ncbi:MAG: NAD(P)/FAD-dependent oxidoreductase [Polyangiaceae bacterium]